MKYLLEDHQTERLFFRKIKATDYPIWLDFFKDPRSSQHWVSDREPPEIACKNWYKNQKIRYDNNRGGMNVLIEKSSGKMIGHCGLLIQEIDGKSELEIAYSLLPEFWNKGFATEAARKCRDVAFQSNFSESLISIISLTNLASKNVALKNKLKPTHTTVYKENEVIIYRIEKLEWQHYDQ